MSEDINQNYFINATKFRLITAFSIIWGIVVVFIYFYSAIGCASDAAPSVIEALKNKIVLNGMPSLCMTTNEWGDTFAGFFAPLALIWIIYSVLVQREELKETRKMVDDQTKSLSKQVMLLEEARLSDRIDRAKDAISIQFEQTECTIVLIDKSKRGDSRTLHRSAVDPLDEFGFWLSFGHSMQKLCEAGKALSNETDVKLYIELGPAIATTTNMISWLENLRHLSSQADVDVEKLFGVPVEQFDGWLSCNVTFRDILILINSIDSNKGKPIPFEELCSKSIDLQQTAFLAGQNKEPTEAQSIVA